MDKTESRRRNRGTEIRRPSCRSFRVSAMSSSHPGLQCSAHSAGWMENLPALKKICFSQFFGHNSDILGLRPFFPSCDWKRWAFFYMHSTSKYHFLSCFCFFDAIHTDFYPMLEAKNVAYHEIAKITEDFRAFVDSWGKSSPVPGKKSQRRQKLPNFEYML